MAPAVHGVLRCGSPRPVVPSQDGFPQTVTVIRQVVRFLHEHDNVGRLEFTQIWSAA